MLLEREKTVSPDKYIFGLYIWRNKISIRRNSERREICGKRSVILNCREASDILDKPEKNQLVHKYTSDFLANKERDQNL